MRSGFCRDGKPELTTPGDGKLLSAIYAAMGRASAKEMVEVKSTSGGITVTGYVGKPTASRGSRSYQHFFVNGRYVKSRMMASALEEAYKNQIMVGRFPICVLHITVPPTAVDVNVHPAKTEVKFLREGDIFDAIHYSVLGALSRAQDRPEMELKSPRPQVQPKQNFYQNVTAQEYRTMTGMLEKSSSVQPSPAVRQQFRQTEEDLDQNVSVHDSVRMVPSVGGAKPAPTATAAVSDTPPNEEKTAWRPEPTIAHEPEPMPRRTDFHADSRAGAGTGAYPAGADGDGVAGNAGAQSPGASGNSGTGTPIGAALPDHRRSTGYLYYCRAGRRPAAL